MLIYAKIRQASGYLFDAENYFVPQRTVLVAESAEKPIHRSGRRAFAQRSGNTQPSIMRDLGVQKRLSQSFDRNVTIFDQSLAGPIFRFGTAEAFDNIAQKRSILPLAGSSERRTDHGSGWVFPNQFAEIPRKLRIVNLAHEASSFHATG